jgi:hypothetical protein
MYEPFVVLFSSIPLPKSATKGARFEVFLAGFLQSLLIWQVLVDQIVAMDYP